MGPEQISDLYQLKPRSISNERVTVHPDRTLASSLDTVDCHTQHIERASETFRHVNFLQVL